MSDDLDNKQMEDLIPNFRPRKTIKDSSPPWLYNSLSDKHHYFDYSKTEFKSVDELLQRMQQLSDLENPFHFRGSSKSTYKIVSFAQRHWNSFRCRICLGAKKGYNDYLVELLRWMKMAENVLPDCPGNCLSDHQVWGYLQHFGCPTPLIDFSRSYLVALHMAIRRMEPGQKEGISVYAVQEGGSRMVNGNDLEDFDFPLTGGTSNVGGDVEIDEQEYSGYAQFKEWKNVYALMIREWYRPWCPRLKSGRLEKQTGLFLYSNEETTPFEELILRKNTNRDANGNPLGNTMHPLKCFDIPKRMVPELKAILKEEDVTDETLGLTPSETDERIKQELVKFENAFVQELGNNLFLKQSKERQPMTENDFTDFATAIQKTVTMISYYLDTFGGSKDNTISPLAYYLEETRRYLRSALDNLLPKKSNDSRQFGTCPMFSELTLQMARLEKLTQRLPKLDPFNPAVLENIIEADLSNAICSFKYAAKEFANLQTGRKE